MFLRSLTVAVQRKRCQVCRVECAAIQVLHIIKCTVQRIMDSMCNTSFSVVQYEFRAESCPQCFVPGEFSCLTSVLSTTYTEIKIHIMQSMQKTTSAQDVDWRVSCPGINFNNSRWHVASSSYRAFESKSWWLNRKNRPTQTTFTCGHSNIIRSLILPNNLEFVAQVVGY